MYTEKSFRIKRDDSYYYDVYWKIQTISSSGVTVAWRVRSQSYYFANLWYLNIGLKVNTGTLLSFKTDDTVIKQPCTVIYQNGSTGDFTTRDYYDNTNYYGNKGSSSITNNAATLYKCGVKQNWGDGHVRHPRGGIDVVAGTFLIRPDNSGKIGFTISGEMNLVNTTPTFSGSGTHASTAVTYTITYDANGGSGAPSSQIKYYGNALTLSSDEPTRIGYTFKGWATSSSGKVSYLSGASYTANAPVTLYAVWEEATYTISYNANGGSGTMSSGQKTRDKAFTLPSNGFTPPVSTTNTYTITFNATENGGSCDTSSLSATKTTNRPFLNWLLNGPSGTIYKVGSEYTSNAPATFYANWGKNSDTTSITLPYASKPSTELSRTITFNANKGKCSTASLTSKAIVSYAHSGWFNSEGTKIGAAGASYIPSESIKLYAQFSSSTGDYSKITLPKEATRVGYDFKGWNTNSSGTGDNYSAGESIIPSSTFTLYAKWKIQSRSLTYDGNGGTPESQTQKLNYGVSTTLSFTPPTRKGYKFLGWSFNTNDKNASYVTGNSISITSNTTLYAVWEPISYTIKYVTDGGTITGSSDTVVVKYGEKYTILNKDKISKPKCTFIRWTTKSNKSDDGYEWAGKSGNWSYVNGESGVDNNKLVLYAVWENTPFKIKYVVYDRSKPYENEKSIEKGTDLLTIKEVIDEGNIDFMPYHKFSGWYTENNTAVDWDIIDNNAEKNSNPRKYTVYARIEPRYKIVYNDKGWKLLNPIRYSGSGWKKLFPNILK